MNLRLEQQQKEWWFYSHLHVGTGEVALCVEHSYGFGLDQYTHFLCHWEVTTTITNLCRLFNNKGWVLCGLAIHTNKSLKAKEELWKLKNFTMQRYNLQSNPLKETKLLQDIIITL
jgi:hypothetical protein